MFAVKNVVARLAGSGFSEPGPPGYASAQRNDSTTFTFSSNETPSASPNPYSARAKNRARLHPALWVGVGFVASFVLTAGIANYTGIRSRSTRPASCDKIAEFAGESGTRLGPPRTTLAAVGKKRVPGPKELLSPSAPASSLYDALRPEYRYLTVDSWSGEVGQFLSAISQLYLGQQTQRISIFPSIWRDGEHYGTSAVRPSDLFDMERFRQETGTLFVEWSDVKPFDRTFSLVKEDDIGCYFSWNGFADGRSYGDYKVKTTAWSVTRPYGFPGNSVEGLVMFDYDETLRHNLTRQASIETGRPIPRNMQASQLICYTNVWAIPRLGVWAPNTFWNGDYKAFDGLQASEGSMREVLHPSLRGVHPEWWSVGRHIDFTPAVWEVAVLAIQRTLEQDSLPASTLTVHIRRGDFDHWCPSGHGCVAPLEAYKSAVDALLDDLPDDTVVLVTTDETSADFHASIRALGWYAVHHGKIGTAALLKERYGESSGWWDSAVDQAILSVGNAFVGTLDSQVSLVSALRVASWQNGETRLVHRPT
ncbi:hypothetical protein JCM10212_004028 [Sporobolomyces blumeae]